MLLHRTPEDRRRDVFAWFFVLMNAGMAAGAAYGGLAANLHDQPPCTAATSPPAPSA